LEPDAQQRFVTGTGDAEIIAALTRVFSNLLQNGTHYTPVGGAIRVALSERDSRAQVRLSDNGVGIAPEGLTRIFDCSNGAHRITILGPGHRPRGGAAAGRTPWPHGSAFSDGADRQRIRRRVAGGVVGASRLRYDGRLPGDGA
jgi:hypothetical protein